LRNRAQVAEIPLLFENVFGKSEEATVYVTSEIPPPIPPPTGEYTLTITIREFLTNKPLEGAKIVADTGQETVTDATGTATLKVASGARTLTISKDGYMAKTWRGTVNSDTLIGESLVPHWMLGLGIVGGATIVTLVATKALKWW
jgi:hypothetical protein